MDVGLGVGLQDYLRSALCTPYDLHGSRYLVKIVMPFKPLPPDLTRRETAKYKLGL